MDQSATLLAAKALLIATGLVAVGGVAFTWAVKTTLGVENVNFNESFHFFFLYSDPHFGKAQEFGQKMRSIFQTTFPGIRSSHPETDDERFEIEELKAMMKT